MRLRNIRGSKDVIASCPFVVQEPESCRGRWAEIFGNENPIHIEVGMGKGRFLMDMAVLHPEINYIGIEMYDSVLLRAVQKREKLETELKNLFFIRMDARQLPEVFAEGEVDRIYLNFSDPWPKARHARRRLTSPDFFARYDKVLVQDGQVEFKTDNRDLFDFSVESLGESETWGISECTYDLHHDEIMNVGNIMTEYEEKFSSMDHPICKLIAKRRCLL